MKNQISFVYGDIKQMSISKGDILEIPFYATETFPVGSMSLAFTIQDNAVKIIEAFIPGGVIEGYQETWDLQWGNPMPPATPEPQIRIGWYDLNNSLNMVAGEIFMVIKVEILHDLPSNFEIKFVMCDIQEVDCWTPMKPEYMVNGSNVRYLNKTIQMDVYKNVKLTTSNSKTAQSYTSKPVFNTCSICKFYLNKKCTLGNFVAAKGGTCYYFDK